MLLKSLFLCATAATAHSLLDRNDVFPSIINTTSGLVQGTTSPFRSGVIAYKGIPFAGSVSGQYRWTAPREPEPWSDVLNATEFGPQCAQQISSAGIFSSGKNTSSEDCLTLNVWVPKNATAAPVYFWIYGGRFEGGSGDVITYDGSGLASKGIIVITINYRLGPFGFLAHPDLSAESGHNASGNYGLMDQQFALKWVQENIEAFGGKKSQVTVGGQSAGSASSLAMMWSPLSRDLINGVISESGARDPHDPLTGSLATSYRNKTDAENAGVAFVKSMNVSSIAELRNISTATLLTADNESDSLFEGTAFENITSAFTDPPLWRPVIDGYVLTKSYGEALRSNDHADVPILTGNNHDESGASPDPDISVATYAEYGQMFQNSSSEFYALYPGNTSAQASNNSNAFFRDLSRVSTWHWAKDWISGGAQAPVYTYFFNRAPAENEEAGAYHGAELWYTFNNIPYADYSSVTWSAKDYEVQQKMSDYWVNFISTGNPNGGNLTDWPQNGEERQVMFLGDSFGVQSLTDGEEKVGFIESWLGTLFEW